MRHQRLPDAIVIENPRYAAGHLGESDLAGVTAARFDFAVVPEGVQAMLHELGSASEPIPLIVAGGVHAPAQARAMLARRQCPCRPVLHRHAAGVCHAGRPPARPVLPRQASITGQRTP